MNLPIYVYLNKLEMVAFCSYLSQAMLEKQTIQMPVLLICAASFQILTAICVTPRSMEWLSLLHHWSTRRVYGIHKAA